MTNRQWLLRARPQGMLKESDFELRAAPIPKPGPGQALVRNRWLALDPAMRSWMEDRPSYYPPVALGGVMRGMTVGEVTESNLDKLAPGDLVSGMTGWQEWTVGDHTLQRLPEGLDPRLALGVLGPTGMTAYFGMLEIGRPAAGEVVVVSAAAGATGSVAGQLAKARDCTVIGIAGGRPKCEWLVQEAHFDAAIDYKSEDLTARLGELCPGGLDVFFDNVGGAVLEAALDHIAEGARIVVCGAISSYNLDELPPGPRNYFNLTSRRARMQGFRVMDYFDGYRAARAELLDRVRSGRLAWKVDVQEGFESAPRTLLRVYSGANFGRQLLRL